MGDWLSDIFIAALPTRALWIFNGLMALFLASLLTFLYFQGRLTW